MAYDVGSGSYSLKLQYSKKEKLNLPKIFSCLLTRGQPISTMLYFGSVCCKTISPFSFDIEEKNNP